MVMTTLPPSGPGQQSDGSRSRNGCITCRIRKKKCDEQRPVCQACRSRQLVCYGFDAAIPSWYLSKSNRQEALDCDEARALRTFAETRYKLSRKSMSVANRELHAVSSSRRSLARLGSYDRPQLQPLLPADKTSSCLTTGSNRWQLHPETIWWDSKMRNLTSDTSCVDGSEMRLLMLFMDVIHPITHTFYRLDDDGDRNWMMDRLVSNQPAYLSALSISACFEHSLSQPPQINDIGINLKVRSLQSRSVSIFRTMIDDFTSMAISDIQDFVWTGIRLLDVIMHLQTLEIFSMLGGHWEMHHRASRLILNHIETAAPSFRDKSSRHVSIIAQVVASLPRDGTRRRCMEFTLSNFVRLDVLAMSTFGVAAYTSCAFQYDEMLQLGLIRPQETMGCQGGIMATIIQIARLEALHQSQQIHANTARTGVAQQSHLIRFALRQDVERLKKHCTKSVVSDAETDIARISIVWALGAQVLLHTVVSETEDHGSAATQALVDTCLENLEALPTRLRIRATWPYTIAGSMAFRGDQQARCRRFLAQTMEDAQSPGIAWKGLMVMEECWRLRRSPSNQNVTWREGMESLGVRVLLT